MRFQLNGNGGQFWWIDNLGTQPWTEIEKFGFDLLPNSPGSIPGLAGSFLLSDPIHIEVGQTVTLRATIANANLGDSAYQDVGFGLLLLQGRVKYVLFAIRPDNVDQFGDMGPGNLETFAPTSAGVTCERTLFPTPIPPLFIIGGVDYSKFGDAATAIASSCKIELAGSYQLVIGMFARGGVGNRERPAGIIVWSAEVA